MDKAKTLQSLWACQNLIKVLSTKVERGPLSSISPFPVACATFPFNYFGQTNLNMLPFDRLQKLL